MEGSPLEAHLVIKIRGPEVQLRGLLQTRLIRLPSRFPLTCLILVCCVLSMSSRRIEVSFDVVVQSRVRRLLRCEWDVGLWDEGCGRQEEIEVAEVAGDTSDWRYAATRLLHNEGRKQE